MSERFTLARVRVHRRRLFGAVTDAELAGLCADEGGLTLGDHRIERSAISEAAVLPIAGSVRVRVRAGGEGQLDISLSDVAEGRALLRALRMDPSRVTASYPISTTAVSGGAIAMMVPIAVLVFSLPVSTMLALAFQSSIPGLLVLAAIAFVIAFLSSPAKVTIGGDGVRLSWWTKGRFIPHTEIRRVVVYDLADDESHRVGVTIEGPRRVDVPMRGASDGALELAELIAERIRAASRATAADGAAVSALARGRRSVRAWIDHLRAIGSGANLDARVAALPAERLGSVLDDPAQSPQLRLAAAIAMAAQTDAVAPARIREVARTCVHPKLRVALEAVTDPVREAELVALLDDVHDAERRDQA